MRYPDKVTSFSNSVFSLFPAVMECLLQQEMSPRELFERIYESKKGVSEFMDTLDCLFALGRIELNEERRTLRYVDRNSMR